MNYEDLRHWGAKAADWAADYHADIASRPVRPKVQPGAVTSRLPHAPPEAAEDMEAIWQDFQDIVPDAMTHWQHPRFFAYFPSNASAASMLAEQLANAISAQCMLWQTSPAATEIEERMVDWLRQSLGLRYGFTGTIHDSATTATLCAVLTMRDRALGWNTLEDGLFGAPRLRVYTSDHAHSSVDKAVRIAGIGQANLVRIASDPDTGAMDVSALSKAIAADRAADHLPAGLVLCSGSTSIGAFDPIGPALKIARAEGLYSHVDAAWAGSAMICPEFRPLWDGVDEADSVVFNPHKWLGVQFDCSVQFLRDAEQQKRSTGMKPAYLVTEGAPEVTDFNEWTVPLGRRFRALKLWFTLRAYGLEGLRARILNHVAWVAELAEIIRAMEGFEIVTEPSLALFTFRHTPNGADPDQATADLLARINDDGRIYLTQTRHQGRYVIRMTAGSFACTRGDVLSVADVLRALTAPPA